MYTNQKLNKFNYHCMLSIIVKGKLSFYLDMYPLILILITAIYQKFVYCPAIMCYRKNTVASAIIASYNRGPPHITMLLWHITALLQNIT
jgi:hypothetical protein